MRLYWSPRSPFVRKVLVVAHEAGLNDVIERLPMVILSTQPNDGLLALNPLGQIPTLVTEEGEAIYDSAAICHYLDVVCGDGRLHPAAPAARTAALRRQALGDGLSSLLLNWLSERSRRQGEQSAMRIAAVHKKLPHIFQALEAEAGATDAASFDVGHAAIVAALGYLDFRFAPDFLWHERYPRLAQWWEAAQQRPSVAVTAHYDELATAGSALSRQKGRA
ncbi:glutathione S-transferase [Bosea sp. LjRoot90]|uniref:glutathione S-transferase n=1 Tax=Bosea sp. LjRoot90 TaxID=3342342 RepID=UPI003ECE039F